MFSERVYRWLLVVYPQAHRREYEDLMVQLFRDRMHFDARGHRGLGLIVWTQTISDLVGSAFKERKEGADMRKLTGFGIALAVLLVAGGIGASVLFAESDGEPKVSVSASLTGPDGVVKSIPVTWQEKDAVATGEPVSVSLIGPDGVVKSIPVTWQGTGAAVHGGLSISVLWQEESMPTVIKAEAERGEPSISVLWQQAP